MRMFVAIPALNEEATVGRVVRAVPRHLPGVTRVDVVVVNDGSTDRTAHVAAEAGATVLHHDATRGVGAAFHSALTYVIANRGDLLVTLDADGQFDPADIPDLARPVIEGGADFATASRFKDPMLIPEMSGTKLWGNRQMSRLVSRLTGGKYYDVSCGMRCYNRRAMLNLNLMGAFTYTQEVFLNLAFKRLRIAEVPVVVRGRREFGKSRVASNLFRYAVNTSRIIFRAYRDYKPMRFFGTIATWLIVIAVVLEAVFFGHYLATGRFRGYLFAGLSGAGFLGLGVLSLHMGLIGDMLNRHRVYLEELLFLQRSEMSHEYPAESVSSLPQTESRTPALPRQPQADEQHLARPELIA